ncbi:hypothetical protein TNCV_3833691 [Trichonephila clavipes]|nr:hypothetical protein TNCV_3833691 [Trichonephila clavipes]
MHFAIGRFFNEENREMFLIPAKSSYYRATEEYAAATTDCSSSKIDRSALPDCDFEPIVIKGVRGSE